MNAIKEWCYQMEWVLVRTHKQPENYVGFNAIISKFMDEITKKDVESVIYMNLSRYNLQKKVWHRNCLVIHRM